MLLNSHWESLNEAKSIKKTDGHELKFWNWLKLEAKNPNSQIEYSTLKIEKSTNGQQVVASMPKLFDPNSVNCDPNSCKQLFFMFSPLNFKL